MDRDKIEEVQQLYYQIGEFYLMLGKEVPKELMDTYLETDKEEVRNTLFQIIQLKKELGEDYSYDEQLLNQL